MTIKRFWDDPYLSKLATRISAVDGPWVCLVETIFFPFSGGQERDTGSIAGHEVLEVKTCGREIFYRLADGHGLEPGEPVEVRIDWPRRYRLMRLHFAAELVLELVYHKLGAEKIGAHIAQEKARIDFLWPESISPLLAEIEAEVDGVVREDREIRSAFSDVRNQRRYWEIPGLAKVPCGGTHLRRTGEIGAIRLKRKNVGKGKERVEILLCDERNPAGAAAP